MVKKLKEVLQQKEENYLIPLYWQRGEGPDVIRDEMSRIDEAGIKAVIVEARPHPDFVGPTWWEEVDVIMEEAKKRNMKVWAFDDDHFPTGRAAGKMSEAPLELQRWYLAERHIDAIGPMKGSSFLIKPWIREGERLVTVMAMKRGETSNEMCGEAIDLMHLVDNGTLYWDVPEGVWRIFMMIETMEGANEHQKGYLNPLIAESTQVLIDAVYEPYYKRYQDEFGETFAGFFSDEPGFYNDPKGFDFESTIGKKGVVLPWRLDMLEFLQESSGIENFKQYLPLLWYEHEDKDYTIRYHYMNVVSQLYAGHFCGVLGNWCRDHGVEYIGHVLEDNNVHSRLGPGAGHFFRSMWEQDMSGIDVVLNQIIPGFDEEPLTWVAGETDSEFFHYGLAKLGSSLGHLDPKKKGRTICEVFGAYGWHEGLKLMKWITDHMLVRGVNYFIPHAYSQKEFPDPDCPPHFYAKGKNPQHRYYKHLNDYTNRLSHLFNDGTHIATAAVLYPAESEWSGESMLVQKPVKELMQNQIDCDIVPIDVLLDASRMVDKKLVINQESFECLIIPYAETLPVAVLHKINELTEEGVPVIFIDDLPTKTSEGIDETDIRAKLKSDVQVVSLTDLVDQLKDMGLYDLEVKGDHPYLRTYHYQHDDSDVYMFFNEHPYDAIKTEAVLQTEGTIIKYDAFENKTYEIDPIQENTIAIELSPYESMVLIVANHFEADHPVQNSSIKQRLPLEEDWNISIATSEEYPRFKEFSENSPLQNMSQPDLLPDFTGTFRYETTFNWDMQTDDQVMLDLGDVFEIADVKINDQQVGIKICPPYHFNITDVLKDGENKLIIDVTNTLVKEQKDFFSAFVQQEPSGLLGPVTMIKK